MQNKLLKIADFLVNLHRIMNLRHFFYCLPAVLMLLLGSCSGKDEAKPEPAPRQERPEVLAMQIRGCSELAAAECRVHKIVTHTDAVKLRGRFMEQDYDFELPGGKRHIAIPMDATVRAYVNLGDFSSENVIHRGDSLEIILPDPTITITSTTIDHDGIRRDVPWLRSSFTDAEFTSYARQGREAIISQIPRSDILRLARHSAASRIIPLAARLGYDPSKVTVTFRRDIGEKDILRMIKPEK